MGLGSNSANALANGLDKRTNVMDNNGQHHNADQLPNQQGNVDSINDQCTSLSVAPEHKEPQHTSQENSIMDERHNMLQNGHDQRPDMRYGIKQQVYERSSKTAAVQCNGSLMSDSNPQSGVDSGLDPVLHRHRCGDAVEVVHSEGLRDKQFWRRAMSAVLPLLLWTFASSGLIVVNKWLMVDRGFRYPLFLTATGQMASVLAGVVPRLVSGASAPKDLTWHYMALHIFPVALCAALTLFLGNYAYLYLSMAFIQILKAFTPACTFLVGVSLGVETLNPLLLMSVAAIAGGTGISTLVESGTPDFHWLGFLSFMASVLTEAVRVLVVQRLMSSVKLGPWDVAIYLGAPTGVLLYAASAVFESTALLTSGFAVLWHNWHIFAAAMCASCALNAISYWAIAATSGLTLKIVGCVKNVLVVWLGVLQGDHVGTWELGGYAVSLSGFVLYTYAQHVSSARVRKKAKNA